jgi:DNA-binding XRE family transcriptional regulator
MHGYLHGHYSPVQSSSRRPISNPSALYGVDRKPQSYEHKLQPVILVQERPKDVNERFGLRLRELRHSRNMTQLRMAVDFGIDRSFISDVERGRKSISLHMLEVLALGLNISLSDLFDGI